MKKEKREQIFPKSFPLRAFSTIIPSSPPRHSPAVSPRHCAPMQRYAALTLLLGMRLDSLKWEPCVYNLPDTGNNMRACCLLSHAKPQRTAESAKKMRVEGKKDRRAGGVPSRRAGGKGRDWREVWDGGKRWNKSRGKSPPILPSSAFFSGWRAMCMRLIRHGETTCRYISHAETQKTSQPQKSAGSYKNDSAATEINSVTAKKHSSGCGRLKVCQNIGWGRATAEPQLN